MRTLPISSRWVFLLTTALRASQVLGRIVRWPLTGWRPLLLIFIASYFGVWIWHYPDRGKAKAKAKADSIASAAFAGATHVIARLPKTGEQATPPTQQRAQGGTSPAPQAQPAVADAPARSAGASRASPWDFRDLLPDAIVWWFLALLTGWALCARSRIVVTEFEDFTGDEKNRTAHGVGTLLALELARLDELYREPGGTQSFRIGGPAFLASVAVENLGDSLQSAVSAESSLGLGFLKIPVGAFMRIFGRLIQGPQIGGSLHRDAHRVLLTAKYLDGKHSRTWYVERPVDEVAVGTDGVLALDAMVAELACHIFTDLGLDRTLNWRAVRSFNAGLRALRGAQRANLSTPSLRRAEHEFLRAQAEDHRFDLALYNLGLVYTELEEEGAAERAFTLAIQRNPQRWEPYFALAAMFAGKKQFGNVLLTCEHCVPLTPGSGQRAKVFALWGFAHTCLHEHDRALQKLVQAVVLAWRSLCTEYFRVRGGEEARRRNITERERVAADCLALLAKTCVNVARGHPQSAREERLLRAADALYRRALSLPTVKASIRREAARFYLESDRPHDAHRILVAATRLDPEDAESWAMLAHTHLALASTLRNRSPADPSAVAREQTFAEKACGYVLDVADYAETDAAVFQTVAEVYRQCGRATDGDRVESIKAVIEDCDSATTADDIPRLRKLYGRYFAEGWWWGTGYAAYTLARLEYENGDFAAAERLYRDAYERLKQGHAREVRRLGIFALLALVLRRQKKFEDAIRESETAIYLDPLSAFERLVAGDLRLALNEFGDAEDEWRNARYASRRFTPPSAPWQNSAPVNPKHPEYSYVNIGVAQYHEAMATPSAARRTERLQAAVKSFESGLNLCRGADRGMIRFWIGHILAEMGRYDEAVLHLRVAEAFKVAPLITAYLLGKAMLRTGALNESVERFTQVLKDGDASVAAGDSQDTPLAPEIDPELSLRELLSCTAGYLALAAIERDAADSESERRIRDARRRIRGLPDTAHATFSRAMLAYCEGRHLVRRGDICAAIEKFEHSLSISADPETYLHLACAYEYKLRQAEAGANRWVDIMRAERLSARARQLDRRGQHTQEAQALLLRLQELSAAGLAARPTDTSLAPVVPGVNGHGGGMLGAVNEIGGAVLAGTNGNGGGGLAAANGNGHYPLPLASE